MLFLSIWEELLPYAMVEAIMSRTLPIASKVGGIPEVVEGSLDKLLFEDSNADQFIERTRAILYMSRE